MTMRIEDTNELDSLLLSDFVSVYVDVDSPDGFFKNAELIAVYNNGAFEFYDEEGEIHSVVFDECKVFTRA